MHRLRGVFMMIGILLSVFLAVESWKIIGEIRRPDLSAPSISIYGEGRIFVKPDIGRINLGVTSEAKTVDAAQQEATEISNRIYAAIKGEGVEEKDIKTTNYSIAPIYNYPDGIQKLRGYQVSQNFEVKIRNLSNSGKIISVATAAGANQVGGLSFTTEDPAALTAEARAKAIEDAKKKGNELAQKLGLKLGRIISFYEFTPVGPIFYENLAGKGGDLARPVAAPEISVGENEIVVNVTITYQIK